MPSLTPVGNADLKILEELRQEELEQDTVMKSPTIKQDTNSNAAMPSVSNATHVVHEKPDEHFANLLERLDTDLEHMFTQAQESQIDKKLEVSLL